MAHRSDAEGRQQGEAAPCPAGEGGPSREVVVNLLPVDEEVLVDAVEAEWSWTSKDCQTRPQKQESLDESSTTLTTGPSRPDRLL